MNKRVNSIEELKKKSVADGIIDSEEQQRDVYIEDEQEIEYSSNEVYDEQYDSNEEDNSEEHDDLLYEVSTEGEKLQFSRVYHTERAEKFKCL